MQPGPFIYVLTSLLILLATGPVPLSAQVFNKTDTAKELVIYLTFDDGPMESSYFIDSLVAKDSVPVEVFVTGFRAKDNVRMTAQLNSYRRQTLIEMANHSFSHANGHYKMYYADPSGVVTDVLLNEDSLQLISRIVRLPGRNTWRVGEKKGPTCRMPIPQQTRWQHSGITYSDGTRNGDMIPAQKIIIPLRRC